MKHSVIYIHKLLNRIKEYYNLKQLLGTFLKFQTKFT